MTEQEIQDHILLYLADLYSDPMSRSQWKRFAFENSNDQHTAMSVLSKLVSNLILDQKEPGVVRLNSIGYILIERELTRRRNKQFSKSHEKETVPQPPTDDEIRNISEELGKPPDYITASRIIEGRSEIYWATEGLQKLTGYTAKELNTSSSVIMLPENADLEKLKVIAEHLLKGEKTSGDFEIKTKSGNLITLHFIAWPLFDSEGYIIGSLTAARQR